MHQPMIRYELALAERLGMTRAALLSTMGADELVLWMAHDEMTAFERQQAADAARNRR